MLSKYFAKKLDKARYFSLGLETITDRGVEEMNDLEVGANILGYDEGQVLNKVETVEKITGNGAYFCVNEKVLLFENQSVVLNGRVTHAKLLKKGDELVGIGGHKILVTSIKRIRGKYHFYRLKVSGNHTYFLNGILMHNASRFWVGGTANWDGSTTTNWAATSGGLGGQSVPTSSDTVTFDTLSNATAYTVTITATANCSDLVIGNPLSGVITLAGSSALNIFGSSTFASGMTRTYTGTITYSATGTGKTITNNGVVFASAQTFNGSGGGWTLQDDLNIGSSTLTFTNGNLNTNGKTITCAVFSSSNGNTRTLTLGGSAINCSSSGVAWQFNNSAGLTFNANSSTITLTGNGPTFNGGALIYNNVVITAGSVAATVFTKANTFANLTITGFAGLTGQFTFDSDQTVTTLLTITGSSAINRVFFTSDTVGTARTFTAASVTMSNVDFQDIAGAGAATWSGTSIGNCGGNSGITFTTPTTQHFKNVNGGTWSTVGNWTSRVPLPQDTALFDTAFGTSKTITADMPRNPSIDFTGATWTTALTLTSALTNFDIYGSLILISGLTLSLTVSNNWGFLGRGAYIIDSKGINLGMRCNLNNPGGTYTLANDAVFATSSGSLFNGGTFDASTFNITLGAVQIGSVSAPTLKMGTGTWTMVGTGGIAFQVASATINAQTSTIKFTDTTNAALSFSGGNKIYNNIWFARGASTGANTISGINTFNDFKSTGTAAHSFLFTNGQSTTVNSFTMPNSSSAVVTISTSGVTTTHSLVKANGGQVSCDWLNIQHSVATPANTWYAGANSVNNQGVATAGSGWIFTVPPPPIVNIAYIKKQAPNRAGSY